MTIEEGLFAFVTADPAVTALIRTRFYPVRIPEGTDFPVAVYQQTNGGRQHASRGVTLAGEGSFSISCWAKTYAEARALGRAIRACFDEVNGTLGTVSVGEVAAELARDDFNDALQLYGTVVDLTVQFQEG